jgi:hypothetical protein
MSIPLGDVVKDEVSESDAELVIGVEPVAGGGFDGCNSRVLPVSVKAWGR